MILFSSREAFHYLSRIMTADVEEFWATALRSDRSVIHSQCLFRGTVDSCLAHPRDIFRFAYLQNSALLLVAHNHPSQDPTPSAQDIRFTRQLVDASRIAGVPILDHLILTQKCYWSFAEKKIYQA